MLCVLPTCSSADLPERGNLCESNAANEHYDDQPLLPWRTRTQYTLNNDPRVLQLQMVACRNRVTEQLNLLTWWRGGRLRCPLIIVLLRRFKVRPQQQSERVLDLHCVKANWPSVQRYCSLFSPQP